MKYLVIAALLAFPLLLLYSRVRPYIKLLKNILDTVQSSSESSTTGNARSQRQVGSKLVRCVGCATWVPANKAITAGAGSSIYCSRECLEKKPTEKERKLAG